jgi:Amt family ammonium transporter
LGGLAVVGLWTVIVTTAIVLVVKAIFPIRVSEEDEHTGLDLASHGERAYDMSS